MNDDQVDKENQKKIDEAVAFLNTKASGTKDAEEAKRLNEMRASIEIFAAKSSDNRALVVEFMTAKTGATRAYLTAMPQEERVAAIQAWVNVEAKLLKAAGGYENPATRQLVAGVNEYARSIIDKEIAEKKKAAPAKEPEKPVKKSESKPGADFLLEASELLLNTLLNTTPAQAATQAAMPYRQPSPLKTRNS